jgi:hypothetical protein
VPVLTGRGAGSWVDFFSCLGLVLLRVCLGRAAGGDGVE